jgi:hypothetical protein
MQSVFHGRDNQLLPEMIQFYAPQAKRIVDVSCNARRMWKGVTTSSDTQCLYYDIDFEMGPNVVCSWDSLPNKDSSIDLIIYDPPHLPLAAASPMSIPTEQGPYIVNYGLKRSTKADNVAGFHPPFLAEAKRVLVPDGLIFAKIKDYVHNHKYQWNLAMFNEAAVQAKLTPCDLIIKIDPCGGNLKSGRWVQAHHAKGVHCYWVVVRNGRCEPRKGVCR